MQHEIKVRPREIIGFGVTVATVTAGVVLWSIATFTSKEDSAKIEKRVDKIEVEMSALRENVISIRSDVSYIRGRIEPKNQ
jgi:hypothetical protein